MWPGTQAVGNTTFPDSNTTFPAFYRAQQPFILSGFVATCATGPTQSDTTTLKVRRTPVGGTIADVANYTHVFTSSSANTQSYYNTTQDFAAGDYIHVEIVYTGSQNATHDITVQLDCF
jgi:hypothetical protein